MFFFFTEMNVFNLILVFFLCALCVVCASKSIETRNKSSQKPWKSFVAKNVSTAINDDNGEKCEELPEMVLAELLGEAYNSRYMSVNRPVSNDDLRSNYPNANTLSKRKVESLPSFYVEETHTIELSEKPAWDIRGHIEDFELSQLNKKRRRKRAAAILNEQKKLEPENVSKMENKEIGETVPDDGEPLTNRNKRAYGRNEFMPFDGQRTNDNMRKLYPWKCDATIKWVDLGPDYFPRFLRTVECTKQYCWYKKFMCKPKSFAVKVLHRRKGICADAANLRKISSFEFRSALGELWKWEEVAINFCCECAVV